MLLLLFVTDLYVVIRHFNKCTKLTYYREVASRIFSN
jgi:hypothetical protein